MSSATDIGTIITKISSAEVQLVKPQLLAFATALQTPGANYQTVRDSLANFALAIPQLNAPAQGVAFNILGAVLATWINTIGTTPMTPAA